MTTLKPVTKDNWQLAIRLEVAPEQRKFVAANLYSIAQSQFELGTRLLGIYNDEETMVGFMMYGPYKGAMWIWRLMVDHRYQRRGYASTAVQALVDLLQAEGHDKIYLSYEPENVVGAQFYASLGFTETGEIDDGEVVACLQKKAQ